MQCPPQLISVASILTYDIYRTYLNPTATGKKLVTISHLSLLFFGLTMTVLSIGLNYVEISMGYLYEMMGIIISSAVLPAVLTLLWNRQNKLSTCLSPLLGLVCSVTSWLLMAKYSFGEITIETTGSDMPMFVGNVVALLSPLVFIPFFTCIKPDRVPYDFVSMRAIKLVDDGLPNPQQQNYRRSRTWNNIFSTKFWISSRHSNWLNNMFDCDLAMANVWIILYI